MDKKDFGIIVHNLDDLITQCKDVRTKFESISLKTVTVKDYNDILNSAASLQGKQDKVVHNDLYHLIGMGNLTVTQQSTLTKKIKELMETRSFIKFLASQTRLTIGKFTDSGTYQCSLLGKKLKS